MYIDVKGGEHLNTTLFINRSPNMLSLANDSLLSSSNISTNSESLKLTLYNIRIMLPSSSCCRHARAAVMQIVLLLQKLTYFKHSPQNVLCTVLSVYVCGVAVTYYSRDKWMSGWRSQYFTWMFVWSAPSFFHQQSCWCFLKFSSNFPHRKQPTASLLSN